MSRPWEDSCSKMAKRRLSEGACREVWTKAVGILRNSYESFAQTSKQTKGEKKRVLG